MTSKPFVKGDRVRVDGDDREFWFVLEKNGEALVGYNREPTKEEAAQCLPGTKSVTRYESFSIGRLLRSHP